MEYSLRAILYLVKLQAIEGLQANFIHYKETYPFCNGVEYRKEVMEYLTKYNNEYLQRILKIQLEICHAIFDKWNNELRFMTEGVMEEQGYDIYCTFTKNTDLPFEDLYLIRGKTYGNIWIEDNRWWVGLGPLKSELFHEKYDKEIPENNVKRMFPIQLVAFAETVWNFLTDYVSDIDNIPSISNDKPQPIAIPDNFLEKIYPYLNILQQKKIIADATERPLKWSRTKSLLAYFADVANDELNLKDSGGRMKIKPFETLFNVSGLSGCINEYKNKTGQKPQGYEDIDKIFL